MRFMQVRAFHTGASGSLARLALQRAADCDAQEMIVDVVTMIRLHLGGDMRRSRTDMDGSAILRW